MARKKALLSQMRCGPHVADRNKTHAVNQHNHNGSDRSQYGFLEPTVPESCVSTLPLCGVSMPKNELIEVLLAMKRLGGDASKNIKELRLFGKFFTLVGQYYVFECSMNERPSKVGR